MSDDHILLSEICETHAITAKAIASAVGRTKSTVYRYLSGEATIPSVVWRWLYGRTRDGRILELVAGDVDLVVVDLPEPAAIDAATLERLLAQRRREIDCEQVIIQILADGQVDRRDHANIAAYRKLFPDLIRGAHAIKAAIDAAYDRSCQPPASRLQSVKGARP